MVLLLWVTKISRVHANNDILILRINVGHIKFQPTLIVSRKD